MNPPRPYPITFSPSAGRTLGVEWELGLVDRTTLDLVSEAGALLARLEESAEEDAEHIVTTELLRNTIEIVTGICADAGEAAAQLDHALGRVRKAADAMGLDLLGSGSHPFATWEGQEITPGARYAELIDRTQWWGRQMIIYGVHVHVGVTSAAKVWPLVNTLLNYLPHLVALTASSPYWDGADTGYASNRSMLFQQLPTAGLPFQFPDWNAYNAYLADVFTTGVIDEVNELRWDIRPSPTLGTIEVRVADGMSSVAEIAAVAALIHCLVLHLEEHLDEGTLPASLPPWHHQENKWRASRYGLDAIVVLDPDNREGLVRDDIERLLVELAPTAERIGCTGELAGVHDILRGGAGYQRQRAAVEAAGGDLHAAVTRAGACVDRGACGDSSASRAVISSNTDGPSLPARHAS